MKIEIPNRITAEDAFGLSFQEDDLISVISLLEEYYAKIREATQENQFSIVVSISHLCENAREVLFKYLACDGYEVSPDCSSPNSAKVKISWLHKIIP